MKINDGSRPSRLDLARQATGETAPGAGGNAGGGAGGSAGGSAAHLAALEAERARVEPFDWAGIRARAVRLEEEPAPRRAAPWWRRLTLAVPLLALAGALLVYVRGPDNRTKGDADIGFYVLRGGQVHPGDPDEPVRAGDRLQFTYPAGPRSQMVLLSLDGDGRVSVFYPDTGDAPVAIVPGERHVLEGSIILDDAPGPEVFVGFFGDAWTVARSREAAIDAWEAGGTDGVRELAAADPDISVLVLEKD